MNLPDVFNGGSHSAASPGDEHRPTPAPPGRPGILVVDDDAPTRALLGLGLQDAGFSVWLAADGDEAIEMYRRLRHRVALVLLDVEMSGRNGLQTLLALQNEDPRVRCCFMDGQSLGASDDDLLKLGALRVFGKPFSLAQVIPVLRELTDSFLPPVDWKTT